MPKSRLDVLLVARGLAESRDWAQRLIRAGEVRVNEQVVDQPAKLFDEAVTIVVAQPPKYVSRGGLKLEAALDAFYIDPAGWVCADVGSSTGGFTDCLLQRGAAKVYAVDVGTHVMHWKVRNDPRVVLMENTNVRSVDALPEPIQLAVIDVAFISLTLVLPKVFAWFAPATATASAATPQTKSATQGAQTGARAGGVIALIKPQFEAGREKVGKGGIVRDAAVHAEVVARIQRFAAQLNWHTHALIDSPILGGDGNKEFLVHLHRHRADQ
jgi:23S rRNA (cytidine1920-2'-O)/16S rRNA (cytidine1409-2'-O)-methyltransferase